MSNKLKITLTRSHNHVRAISEFGTATDYYVPVLSDGSPAYVRCCSAVSAQQVFAPLGDAVRATPDTLLSVVSSLIKSRLGADVEIEVAS
jgi:hypothetical protein